MNDQNQKTNWFLDFLILAGFLLSFFLELTGLAVHQWLGLAVFLLIIVHLIRHWNWVKCVFTRFFGKVTPRVRIYALIDFVLLFGLIMIVETGLLTSTWFNFNIANFSTLMDLHLTFSIGTLVLTVIKIGLHSRWIDNIANKIFRPSPAGQPSALSVETTPAISRRQFLVTMGLVSVGSAIAIANVWPKRYTNQVSSMENTDTSATQENAVAQTQPTATQQQVQPTQASETSTSVPQTAPTVTVQPTVQPTTQPVVTCYGSCRRGNHCSYPGVCRDYRDNNGNGLCDLGECG